MVASDVDDADGPVPRRTLGSLCIALLLVVSLFAASAAAHPGAATDRTQDEESNDDICEFDRPGWRAAQTVAGVAIQASEQCRPDNPATVAAAVNGTNNVPMDVLMDSGLSRDAVRKRTDRDGDGDPDVVEITLEATSVNEFDDRTDEIAPGVDPAFWVFAPKTRGMVQEGSTAEELIRMPTPPIRVEQNDTVRVTVENAHYFPHTIHFHGVDHPFAVNGSGNDGVPQVSEKPIEPGEERTYEFQPREPGTMFYHCHVVPNVHVTMGLNGMFIVEEERPDNHVQTFNVGAGEVRHPSAATLENYTAEYDLQYQGVDRELHEIPQEHNDPRTIAKKMNREWDATERDPDYFLLNGNSFPYTLRESLIAVEEDERYRLRVLNGGSETLSLHTHGHKVTIEAYDGVAAPEGREITRDVVTLTAAQRVDLALNTTNDGRHSYGPGLWFTHDHREQAITTDGISPGGTITMIAYDSYLDEGVPQTDRNLAKFFDSDYYNGSVPVWGDLDEERLGAPPENRSDGESDGHGDDHSGESDHGHSDSHDHDGAQTAADRGGDGGSLPAVPLEVGVLLAGAILALGLSGRAPPFAVVLVAAVVALVVLGVAAPAVGLAAAQDDTTPTPTPTADGGHDDGDEHGTEGDGHDDGDGHEMDGDDGHGDGDEMDGGMMMEMKMVENGTIVNENTDEPPGECEEIRGETELTVEGGWEFAGPGEKFSFERDSLHLPACTRVTVTFVNHDEGRHQWMVHGLPSDTYPMGMFNVEVNGPGSATGTFVTPKSGEFHTHCSLPQHEQKGMAMHLMVGDEVDDESGNDGASGDGSDGDGSDGAGSDGDGSDGDAQAAAGAEGSPAASSGPGFGVAAVVIAMLGVAAAARVR